MTGMGGLLARLGGYDTKGPFGSQDPGWIQAKSREPRICIRQENQARNSDAGLVSSTKTQWIRPRATSAILADPCLKNKHWIHKNGPSGFYPVFAAERPLIIVCICIC